MSTDARKDHRTTWVIQLMSEPKFSPRLKEISPTTMARVTLIKNTEHVWFVHAA